MGAGAQDDALLARYSEELLAALDECVGDWVVRCVAGVADRAGVTLDRRARGAALAAAERARVEVVRDAGRLLRTDIDEQRSSPLEVLRSAVRHPTAVLRSAGVPPVARDAFAAAQFPDDDYDLAPASFAEVDERLHEPGLRWGAAKAHVHLRRRREEGRR